MLTREQVQKLKDDLQACLDVVSAEVGYKLVLGSGRFGETVVFKLECSPIQKDGTTTTVAQETFRKLASVYGLDPASLGKEFIRDGRRFKITGLTPRRHKFPVDAESVPQGSKYKFPIETIKRCLAGEKFG